MGWMKTAVGLETYVVLILTPLGGLIFFGFLGLIIFGGLGVLTLFTSAVVFSGIAGVWTVKSIKRGLDDDSPLSCVVIFCFWRFEGRSSTLGPESSSATSSPSVPILSSGSAFSLWSSVALDTFPLRVQLLVSMVGWIFTHSALSSTSFPFVAIAAAFLLGLPFFLGAFSVNAGETSSLIDDWEVVEDDGCPFRFLEARALVVFIVSD